jgi:hypothetical protein
MSMITEPSTSSNTSPSELHNGPPGPAPECDTGYAALQQHEADPNPDEFPPDFRDATQAALNAHARGFDLIRLRSDGTPAGTDAAKIGAVVSSLHRRVLFFFRRPRGVSIVEGELLPGLGILTEEYVALPSGNVINRQVTAPPPPWLLEQIAALADIQTSKGNGTTGVGSAGTDTTFSSNTLLSPPHLMSATAEGGVR